MQLNHYRKSENMDIKYQKMRFLVGDGPNDQNFKKYIQDLSKFNVNVRVCQSSCDKDKLEENCHEFFDAGFESGQTASPEIREILFFLLKEKYKQNPNTCVSVHCVSGLERSSVMVAMALMELGMSYEEAAELIRHKQVDSLKSRQVRLKSVKKNNQKIPKLFYNILKRKIFK